MGATSEPKLPRETNADYTTEPDDEGDTLPKQGHFIDTSCDWTEGMYTDIKRSKTDTKIPGRHMAHAAAQAARVSAGLPPNLGPEYGLVAPAAAPDPARSASPGPVVHVHLTGPRTQPVPALPIVISGPPAPAPDDTVSVGPLKFSGKTAWLVAILFALLFAYLLFR